MVCMDNEKEGLKRIFEGEVRRSIAKESAYPASHLATSVITFHVSNTSLITSWGIVTTAKVIVRLAIRLQTLRGEALRIVELEMLAR